MKNTTATQKKTKEVDTETKMPEQPKTRGSKEFKGKKIQRTAPARTAWTEEKVKERIKSEILSGQFGRGKVIPRFERKEEQVHEKIDENVQDELSDESLKKVTSVLRKMADTVVEFAEVMAEIGNTRTGGGIIKKTFENIAEMINVSALEQAFLQTRKNYPAQPTQPTTSQSQQQIQTPSFDLGVPSPQPAAIEQPQDKFDSNELQNIARDLEEDSENTISDEQQLDTTPADNTMKEFFDSEQLFEYAGHYLNRETFQSMRAGELESVIVDVWCLRLNQLDLNRRVDKPKRIFFSTEAFLQLDSPTNWEMGDNTEQSSYQIDFEQCLDTEINNVGKLDISDAQLLITGLIMDCIACATWRPTWAIHNGNVVLLPKTQIGLGKRSFLMLFGNSSWKKQGMVKEREQVALVQSGTQPIWRLQSTHNIQLRKV
nr:uncharacterized protein LOC109179062 [Ipomoea batatas]